MSNNMRVTILIPKWLVKLHVANRYTIHRTSGEAAHISNARDRKLFCSELSDNCSQSSPTDEDSVACRRSKTLMFAPKVIVCENFGGVDRGYTLEANFECYC